MASVPVPALTRRRWHTGRILLGLAVVLVLVLRLMPAEQLLALDAIPLRAAGDSRAAHATDDGRDNPVEHARHTFTGSAYFFAENAFAATAPQPGTTGALTDNPHIMALDTGPQAAVAPLSQLRAADRMRAIQCMTNAIYYEAGNEPEEGQRAVAQVVLNRLASPLWPNSVCAVIYQGGERSDMRCQFTFSCDGSMARVAVADKWARAWRVARRAIDGDVFAPVGLATFYHTLAVHPPWADRLKPVAVIGAHIFYRLPGWRGEPGAFTARHAGFESAQPGPYAYRAPQRTVPLPPPGPASEWLNAAYAPPSLPSAGATGTSSPPYVPAGQTPWAQGPGQTPYHQTVYPQSAPPPAADDAASRLPASRVRPEYRNSGRPL